MMSMNLTSIKRIVDNAGNRDELLLVRDRLAPYLSLLGYEFLEFPPTVDLDELK
jgi:hypothetical protein